MYPLSFNEFLNAQGLTGLLEAKKDAFPEVPLIEPIHDKLVEQIRYFHLIGGMPAAVNLWIQTSNYQECRKVHNDIMQSYIDDFSKHGSRIESQLLRNTMSAIAANVCTKFKYSSVANYDSRQVKQALELLAMAGIIVPVTHTSANEQPLGAEANEKFRKFIFLDTALLLHLRHFAVEDILISTPSEFVDKGSLVEMFVGLELLKYDTPYEKQSLYQFIEQKKAPFGIRCALEPYSYYEHVKVYPLYAASELIHPAHLPTF